MILPPLSLALLVAASGGDLPSLLEKADAAYAVRDEAGRVEELTAALDEAEKLAPDDFEVLWRRARLLVWISDDPWLPNDEKSRVGRQAWDYGDRAAAANPDRVEGHYFAAIGTGNYSLGIGVLKALAKGIEGKFKERLSRAEAVEPGYQGGGIQTAWGRLYYKLPWPKYDGKKSEAHYRRALEMNPANVRARVYLAELHEKEDRPEKARAELEAAAAAEPGAYDGPEERRYQKLAREMIARTDK
jgi:tetratricopeptide (TPR) repeat protein